MLIIPADVGIGRAEVGNPQSSVGPIECQSLLTRALSTALLPSIKPTDIDFCLSCLEPGGGGTEQWINLKAGAAGRGKKKSLNNRVGIFLFLSWKSFSAFDFSDDTKIGWPWERCLRRRRSSHNVIGTGGWGGASSEICASHLQE